MPLSCKKLRKILDCKPIKLYCYNFSKSYSSLTKVVLIKKTNRVGETKTLLYGIGNEDCVFKYFIVHHKEKMKFGYLYNNLKNKLISQLKGSENPI